MRARPAAAAAGGAFDEAQAFFDPAQQALTGRAVQRRWEHRHRLATGGGLGQHRGAVAGDDEAVGQREQGAAVMSLLQGHEPAAAARPEYPVV